MIDRPAVIIPGARRCGTSTLFRVIKRHELIDAAKMKEPNFFALEKNVIENNFQWYLDLFSKEDEAILDGSTLYFSSERAMNNIDHYLKDPKIIIMLRDPAKRCHSAFWHMKGRVSDKEKREFSDIVKKMERKGSNNITTQENNLLKKAIEKDLVDENHMNCWIENKYEGELKVNFEDSLWEYKYFQGSIYSNRVEKWSKLYSDTKVVYLEKLIKEPKSNLLDIFDFIGLPVDKRDLDLPHANKNSIPTSWLAKTSLGDFIHTHLKWINKDIEEKKSPSFIKALLQLIYSKYDDILYMSRPSLSEKNYLKLKKIFKEEYQYWFSKDEELKELWTF